MKPKKELIIPIYRRSNPNKVEDWYVNWSFHFSEKEVDTFRQSNSDFIEKPSTGWTEKDGMLKNQRFNGPFEIVGIFSTMSTAGYTLMVKLPNQELLVANLKYDTLFEIMKDGKLDNKNINCDLTFKKIGQSYFLIPYV